MERKRSGKKRRGRDRERSVSRNSNSGHLKRNGATCQRAAHEAIGADMILTF